MTLGSPRLHLREVGSTSDRARELATNGAPHGTLVTAGAQTAGRGRQGRTWTTAPGRALAMSLVLRDVPELLPLRAGVAVAQAIGPAAQIKWPNDVLVDGRKVAGILVEGRPQEHWAVVGIGLNVALAPDDFPPELRATAATLGLTPEDVEPTLTKLLEVLEAWLGRSPEVVLEAVRARDALRGHAISWSGGEGTADGIDGDGRLMIRTGDGRRVALDAGEVHLGTVAVNRASADP
jgi:BirA family transcriptional regulator, biotin operon repressor / biotin---[acetyl-CoA-carboxylase] ligase